LLSSHKVRSKLIMKPLTIMEVISRRNYLRLPRVIKESKRLIKNSCIKFTRNGHMKNQNFLNSKSSTNSMTLEKLKQPKKRHPKKEQRGQTIKKRLTVLQNGKDCEFKRFCMNF
jgi:hypothetical protein